MAGAISMNAGIARRRNAHVCSKSAALAADLHCTVGDQWAFTGFKAAQVSLDARGGV